MANQALSLVCRFKIYYFARQKMGVQIVKRVAGN